MYSRVVCHELWLQGSMLLLLLHLKWRVNTKQAHLIDSADWREEEEDEGEREVCRGEASRRKSNEKRDGHGWQNVTLK